MAVLSVSRKDSASVARETVASPERAALDTRTPATAARFAHDDRSALLAATRQPRTNRTGLPDRLKAGVEAMSGVSLDDVRVHRNSAKPAQMRAHAFAQGGDIHLGPGQERHLPHETWHVVQQKQGRVRATRQMKGGVAINDDAGLEREADVMGARAEAHHFTTLYMRKPFLAPAAGNTTVQAVWIEGDGKIWRWDIPISGVQWMTDGKSYWFEITIAAGEQFEEFAGKAKMRSHPQWKELGAGDLPEGDLHFEAMHKLMVDSDDKVVWAPITITTGGKLKGPPAARTKPFYLWLYKNEPKPTGMNCYEVVLYAAVLAGIRSKAFVKAMIDLDPETLAQGGPHLAKRFRGVKLADKDNEKKVQLAGLLAHGVPRGHIVLFGANGEHVALSTGTVDRDGNHLVLELDQHTGGVTLSAIEVVTEKYRWFASGPLPV